MVGRRGLRWEPALTADGTAERDVEEVAEVTPCGDLSGWPPGSRLLVRREIPHPGAQLTFTDVQGHRFQLWLTNLAEADLPYLEALYRGRGRCEQTIRALKATGLAHLPSADFATNQAWPTAVLLAEDLLAWFRGLGLTGGGGSCPPSGCATRSSMSQAGWCARPGAPPSGWRASGRGRPNWWPRWPAVSS